MMLYFPERDVNAASEFTVRRPGRDAVATKTRVWLASPLWFGLADRHCAILQLL